MITAQKSSVLKRGATYLQAGRSVLASGRHGAFGAAAPRPRRPRRQELHVRATTEQTKEDKKKELVDKIEKELKTVGMDRAAARTVLKQWQEAVGHEVTPDNLRRILAGQSGKVLGLVLLSTLIDGASAYVAFSAGTYFFLAQEQYGWWSVVGQGVAYLVGGYFVAGVAFDLFKLGAVLAAGWQFRVNAPAFLAAIEDIAGSNSTGFDLSDKALEAVGSVKVLQALNTMADMLREQTKSKAGGASGADLLTDLGGYLTLDRAQRLRGFDAGALGLTDAEAVQIAAAFSAYDLNDDGTLSYDEFRKLCARYAPELATEDEVKAALALIDTNKDGSVDFMEFVQFWLKQIKGG